MITLNENLLVTIAEKSSHVSAQDTQNALPASTTAYFDSVILPLFLDIAPKSLDLEKISHYLPCLAFFAGDRIESKEIRSKLQNWAHQVVLPNPSAIEIEIEYVNELVEHVNGLVQNCQSSLHPSYKIRESLKQTVINSAHILEDLEDFLISLDCKLSPPEARKALEHICDVCHDEVEFTSITDGKMRGLVYGFNDGDWRNAIADFKRRINDRRYEKKPQESHDVVSQADQAKILIKAWLLEDDPVVKALSKSNICRVYGLDKKTFEVIADSLDENSSKPKAKRLKPHEFMALPTSGTPLLAPGIASMGVTIIAGNPGAGKTTLAYDLAGAVLMGDDFLGELTSRQGSVLFVNCDEPHQWGQDKLINRGITSNYEVLMDWDVSQWGDLETAAEDMRPALVIIDSFSGIHNDPNFDENSVQASQTAKKLERLSAKYCVPIVLIHHLGKSKDNKGINKLRGSTAIAASVSSVLILEGEGTHKRLYQPKIRGSEPLDLTVEMDVENGRFRVTGGNVTDDATKSLKAKLIDFFAANPGVMFENSELRDRFPGIERKTLTNALNKTLGTVIGNGKIIKRPSKVNQKFKVYGLECITSEGLSPYTPLSPSSSPVNSGDYEAETITTQSLGVVTALSPDCHHLEDDKTVMTTETFAQPDCHVVTTESQPRSERVPPVADDSDAVPSSDSVETAPIVETENPNYSESENGNKTEPSFRFKGGDRVFSAERPDFSLELIDDPDGEWCRCKHKFGIGLYACAELIPDASTPVGCDRVIDILTGLKPW